MALVPREVLNPFETLAELSANRIECHPIVMREK